MNKTRQHIVSLIDKYLREEALSGEENADLRHWLQVSPANRLIFEEVQQRGEFGRYLSACADQSDTDHAFALFQEHINQSPAQAVIAETSRSVHRVHFLKQRWFRYAAAIILVLGITIYVWNSNQKTEQLIVRRSKPVQMDIAPGTNRAILTVDNKQMDLAADKTGITVGSAIAYSDGEHLAAAGTDLTLRTPKGGQYQVTLPDGSKVWLNAASSISFPASFRGTRRNVTVTGEVYMEIAQNAKQPFIVTVAGGEIQVLGTSFNVNSYDDDRELKTTLIEGSIQISAVGQVSVIKPGQQAIVSDKTLKTGPANIEQTLAWKNGIFDFNGVDLKTVMRQLERWYDITVEYQTSATNVTFRGAMYRNVALSVVLDKLNEMGIQTRLQGKTLIVL